MMSGHDANPFFFNNNKKKDWTSRKLADLPLLRPTIFDFFPYPHLPQSGLHVSITPKKINAKLQFLYIQNEFLNPKLPKFSVTT